MQTVGFRAPALSLIASNSKLLDLRVGNPLRVGARYLGHEGSRRVPFCVSAAESFPNVEAVWHALLRRGTALSLFPLAMQDGLGLRVSSPQDAALLYARLCGAPARGPVTLYSVAALSPQPPTLSSSPTAPRPVSKVLLTRAAVGNVISVWAGDRADGGGLDVVGGKADVTGAVWESPDVAMLRELSEELPALPRPVRSRLEWSLLASPAGSTKRHLDLSAIRRPQPPQCVHYWCCSTSAADGSPGDWSVGGALEYEWRPSTGRWVMPTALLGRTHPVSTSYTEGMVAALAADPAYQPQLFLEMALRRWARRRATPQGWASRRARASVVVPPAAPAGRVALVLCSKQSEGVAVLCRRDAADVVSLPSMAAQSAAESLSVAMRLAEDVLADAARARASLVGGAGADAVQLVHPLPSGFVACVACGASSLPVALDVGSWVWVPAAALARRGDAMSTLAGQVSLQWARPRRSAETSQHPPPSCPNRARRKHRPRRSVACARSVAPVVCSLRSLAPSAAPETPTMLGRVERRAAMGQAPPPHLHSLPPFIADWHERVAPGLGVARAQYRPALVSARKEHRVHWHRLGVPEGRQREERLEAVVAAAMTEYHAIAPSPDRDRQLLERILVASRQRAKGRGASEVTPKDVAEAARAMDPSRRKLQSPADVLPSHYDELMTELAGIRGRVDALVAKGVRRPRVLVAGERHSVVACMYREAGADVATCDLEPSDCPSIPHYRGDMHLILDLGWDLIIGHPPCTYLSNAGSLAMSRDPGRIPEMERSAALFRRIYRSNAPFVAVENPTMHRRGRDHVGLGPPDQYVHPYQHGTPHQKRTGFHLKGLPTLKPTCEVDGRERPMANLPEVPERSELRSRTYVGIAGAMAVQWMPTLMAHLGATAREETPVSALDLVRVAEASGGGGESHVVFRRFTPGGSEQLLVAEVPGWTAYSSPFDGYGDEAAVLAALRSLRGVSHLPQSWLEAAARTTRHNPSGCHRASVVRGGAACDAYLWVVDLDGSEAWLQPVSEPSWSSEWRDSLDVVSDLEGTDRPLAWGLRQLLGTANRGVVAHVRPAVTEPTTPPSPTFLPWRHPPEFSKAVRPPAPVSKVHYIHGAWRSWSHVQGTYPPQYAWQPLPAALNTQLCQLHSRRCRRPMEFVGEESLNSPFSNGGPTPAACSAMQQWHDDRGYPAETGKGPESGSSGVCPDRYAPDTLQLHQVLRDDWARSERAYAVYADQEVRRQFHKLPAREQEELFEERGAAALGLAGTADEVPEPRLGLGVDPSHLPRRGRLPYSKSPGARRVAHQADYLRFVPSSAEPGSMTVAAATVAVPSLEEPPTRPLSDAVDTPKARMYHHCLYTQDVTVCRRKGERFWIDCALTDFVRTLTDTGAAPSIVTTGLLAQLPRDAMVTREHGHVPYTVEGPDGGPLALQGHATIVFDLNGRTYRHRFLVAEGKPLMILGCDFLAPWKAVTEVNQDEDGRGFLRLGDHEVRVTTNPADLTAVHPSVEANVAPAGAVRLDGSVRREPVVRVAHVAPPEPIFANSELAGLSPGEIARKRLTLVEGSYVLYTQEAIVLPPMTKRTVYVNAPKEVVERRDSGVVTPLPLALADEKRRLLPELNAVAPDADGKVPVTLWNTSRHKCTVPSLNPICGLDTEGTVISSAASTGGAPRKYEDLPDHLKEVIGKIEVDPQKRLSASQLAEVWDLIAEFADVFAVDPKEPKHTHLLEVELELKPGAQPHRHAPSRHGPEGQKIVDAHIDDMESRNIIRKSNSAWGSRVVLVSKKDGSIRFCVDYRDTNSKLQVMDSPIPLTAEAIDRLASGQGDPTSLFLSTLDLASGFWCLPIREADKALTSFVTHRGKYEFNYLPFGIQSGPSYMCRLMDAALQGLAWDICMPYLDDTGVWSTGVGPTPEAREEASYQQMMQRLRLVFERFRHAQLSCKASKCELFATSAAYLGHIVSRKGLGMDPKKIEAIRALDTTQIDSLAKVRSFLGLASYYRRFVKGFAGIAAPLHDLTKDGVDVAVESQGVKAQTAMKDLIGALVSEPVLATPRFDRQFIVKTDAAITEGIGGVLSQHDDDKKERVNAYYGRRLRKAEHNWTVTEVELLAALESISNWRPYLWGREFRLVIDHSALRWLHTMRDTFEGGPASRLTRWIMKLQEYRFTVEHKPGVAHCDADGVSRLVQLVAAAMDGPDGGAVDPGPIRRELAAWAARVKPSGSDYDAARDRMLTAYWQGQQACVAGAVTARKLQDAARAQRQVGESRLNIINYYLGTGAPNTDALRREQQADPDCRYLMDLLVSGTCGDPQGPTGWRRARWALREARHLEVRDGLLYRRDPLECEADRGRLRLYVPYSQRYAMLTAFHDHFGHQSENPMHRALKVRYYWPAMKADISHYVGECHECTLAKRTSRRRGRAHGPSRGHYPFDLLYVDVLDMAPTHDYAESGTGYRKLLVFVDSLTRWVEAVPFHSDPTSEQVLDAFMTHVVARHGCPRTLRSDHGSNFVSELCDTILAQTGCNLRPSSAEHHESVGIVERFNATISSMVRAADEGGMHWADHLPFLLMSYRATPHRVTQQSPAALLYGRELRLPAQMADPSSSSIAARDPSLPAEVADYAMRLHESCVWAWQAASEASLEAQSEAAANSHAKTVEPTFAANDRVARLLPGSANKLKYLWSGPYRIAEVLAGGRYRLTDLENRIMHDEFDASMLRPYRTVVDAEDLQADEYLVDYLFGHRDRRGAREYRVKWRGYPRSEATWEPRAELERRSASLVQEYESTLSSPTVPPVSRRRLRRASPGANASAPAAVPTATGSPEPPPPAVASPVPSYVSDDEPTEAEFMRGAWRYGRREATQRGSRVRWYPPSHFLPEQLETFESLRQAWRDSHPSLAAVVAVLTVASKPALQPASTTGQRASYAP